MDKLATSQQPRVPGVRPHQWFPAYLLPTRGASYHRRNQAYLSHSGAHMEPGSHSRVNGNGPRKCRHSRRKVQQVYLLQALVVMQLPPTRTASKIICDSTGAWSARM